ncbi:MULTISPECIES: response regulator transcription factor [unclassified Clostridium]|uniref:response regulator transcription factor n=1 Tax=Clostridium TaxID=1485 RepID=UPI001C8BC271|nr:MULTISPECIES: response regulator transcription factor [unclassified Clostridium]MBX9139058.1 response regulator transcription factor [Clostridium sp. K12(2020)]MBX9145844.1 response regulator transcription factor [Clostridium sp. K13]MDU2289169.1 response regulator transcription factor [Clostridium celatum]MDU4324921.1 response regulator transcription factor [Clostridium celatum]
MSYKILVVEDDNQIQELIVEFLSSQDYIVETANDGVEGYEKFKEGEYDLVILDVMMPRLDGHSLCKMIKSVDKEVSVIFLTALGDEENEIKGFDLKADDYISKPFSFNILIKRVEAVLRRKNREKVEEEVLRFEGLKLELQTFKSYVEGEEIELTLKEFNILKLMISSYPTVVSREKLIEKIWGYDYFGDTRVIDAHMKNIRKKIKKDYIKTIKGVGYVLEK